jgi:hypothetical protein
MKLAWLCYEHDDDYDYGYDSTRAIVLFEEPSDYNKYKYAKIVPIVYARIETDET